jgi:hypothetical protein
MLNPNSMFRVPCGLPATETNGMGHGQAMSRDTEWIGKYLKDECLLSSSVCMVRAGDGCWCWVWVS